MPPRRILVPLVVLALAGALYFWPGVGGDPIVDVPDDVHACTQNLRALYQGLAEYHQREGHLPQGSGNAFLGALIAEGVWADSAANRARLTCPGRGAQPVARGLDLSAPAALPDDASAYAARDMGRHPLEKFPSGGAELEPLVACDNARGLNHADCMNVLYSDGQVRTLVLSREIEAGRLAPGSANIPVGADSPLADLTKLVADAP